MPFRYKHIRNASLNLNALKTATASVFCVKWHKQTTNQSFGNLVHLITIHFQNMFLKKYQWAIRLYFALRLLNPPGCCPAFTSHWVSQSPTGNTSSGTTRATILSFRSEDRGLSSIYRAQIGGDSVTAAYGASANNVAEIKKELNDLEFAYASGAFKFQT